MNYGEARALVLKLLDESKPKADLTGKLPAFFTAAQQKVAAVKPIIRARPFEVKDGVYQLPEDVMRVRRVRLPEDARSAVRFLHEGERLYFDANGNYVMEYAAYPAALPDNVPEDTRFEVDEDTHMALCYYVAAQCQSMEYDRRFYEAFLAQFQEELVNFAQDRSRPVAAVETDGGWL